MFKFFSMKELTALIRTLTHEAGFEKTGITQASMPEKSSLLTEWLQAGYHGEMSWMKRYQHLRQNIKEFFPEARSVVCVAQNYFVPGKHGSDPAAGKISRYAWGRDYHKVIPKKLKDILKKLKEFDPEINGRVCVDTAPFMDKLWAEKAGIGWQGKHTNLITRDYGSWVFLGALILNRDLICDTPALDHCGTCSACIQACPTQALTEPGILDATRCIAYLTIEMREHEIPEHLSPDLQNYIFGCDICQEVCPWSKFQRPTAFSNYQPRSENLNPGLEDLAQIGEEEFNHRFNGTPVKRAGWKKFVANVNTVRKANQN
jgi:epoxyqueuosine reductase